MVRTLLRLVVLTFLVSFLCFPKVSFSEYTSPLTGLGSELPPINLDAGFTRDLMGWRWNLKGSWQVTPGLTLGGIWTPEGFSLTSIEAQDGGTQFSLSQNGSTTLVKGTDTFVVGGCQLTLGRTLTIAPQGGAYTYDIDLQRDGNLLGVSVGTGGWEGRARVVGANGVDYGRVNIGLTQNPDGTSLVYGGIQGRILLGGLQAVAEYDLRTDRNYELEIGSLDSEAGKDVKEKAEAIATELAGQMMGSGGMDSGKDKEEELRIPQGWFLSLTPQEQKFAVGIITHRLGVELTRQGVDISSIKLVVGIGEGSADGQAQTIIAFGLKRAKDATGGGLDLGMGKTGGMEEKGDSSGLNALYIQISQGSLSARLGFDLSQGLRVTDVGFGTDQWSFTAAEGQGVQLRIGPEGAPVFLVATGGNRATSASISFPVFGGIGVASLGLVIDPQGLGINFGVRDTNGIGTSISLLPGGMREVTFYGPFQGLSFRVRLRSDGTIGIGVESGNK